MPAPPYPFYHTQYLSAVGPSTPAISLAGVGDAVCQTNSTAGHVVTVEGSIDGGNWLQYRRNIPAVAPSGHSVEPLELEGLLGVAAYARFNVASLTSATTITAMLFGHPVS